MVLVTIFDKKKFFWKAFLSKTRRALILIGTMLKLLDLLNNYANIKWGLLSVDSIKSKTIIFKASKWCNSQHVEFFQMCDQIKSFRYIDTLLRFRKGYILKKGYTVKKNKCTRGKRKYLPIKVFPQISKWLAVKVEKF